MCDCPINCCMCDQCITSTIRKGSPLRAEDDSITTTRRSKGAISMWKIAKGFFRCGKKQIALRAQIESRIPIRTLMYLEICMYTYIHTYIHMHTSHANAHMSNMLSAWWRVQSWRNNDWPKNAFSTVRINLEKSESGTQLILTQSDVVKRYCCNR